MRQKNPLLDALVPGLRQRVLAEFLIGSPGAIYRSELARKLGVTASSLQTPLRSLAAAGILSATVRGREVFYQSNPQSPVFADLRGLLVKTTGLSDVLREALSPFAARVRIAFVFGSFASGTEGPASDVDLLVVGSVKLSELASPLRGAEERLSRPVSVVPLSTTEFRKKARADHFLRSVLAGNLIFLVGTRDELEEIVGERAGRSARDEPTRARKPAKGRSKKPR